MTTNEARVMIPPEVVRMRASSTVLAKASSLVNRDLAGISSRSDDHKVEKVDHVEQIARRIDQQQ
jgi:hypothetical protein